MVLKETDMGRRFEIEREHSHPTTTKKRCFSIEADREEQIVSQCSRIQEALEKARTDANMYPESILTYLSETMKKTADTVCTLLVHISEEDRKNVAQGIWR